jgi:hypothetical protein
MPIFRLAHRRDAAESLLAEYLIKERQRRAAHSKVIESTRALWNRFAEESRVVRRRSFDALMTQFDVYRNPGRHRDSIPFVVVVQSSLYDDYRRRVVVPLVDKSSIGKVTNRG